MSKHEQVKVIALRPIRANGESKAVGDIFILDKPDASYLHNCKKVSKDEDVIAAAEDKAAEASEKKAVAAAKKKADAEAKAKAKEDGKK